MNTDRQLYEQLNLETIPLMPGTKKPLAGTSWLYASAQSQWDMASDGANIGIRLQGDPIVLDADSPEAVQAIGNLLASLGHSSEATVLSATDGRGQFYVPASNVPDDFKFRKFSEIDGELRARASYVTAPNSVVDGKPYVLQVDLEATLTKHPIRWEDLKVLVPDKPTGTIPYKNWMAPPIPFTVNGRLAYKTEFLVSALRMAVRGQRVAGYPSRSEAESALVTELILKGWTWYGIRGWIKNNLPYLIREKGEDYLRYTAARASQHVMRPQYLEAYAAAEQLDDKTKQIYQAFVSQATRWHGKYEWDNEFDTIGYATAICDADYRTLGRLLSRDPKTAFNWTKRHAEPAGLVRLVKKGSRRISSVWEVRLLKV